MQSYKYILQPYKGMSTRYHCPACNNRNKTFTRYIDTETGEYIADHVGRCNRENNCSYHYTPKQYFQYNNISFEKKTFSHSCYPIVKNRAVKQHETTFIINENILKQSLDNYDNNHFIFFLENILGQSVTAQLIKKYFIGTSNHWNGATIFWQIDISGKIRTGKIMLYNPATGKRVKEPYNYIQWVHKIMNLPEYNLKQCLFGEHLLKGNTKPAAIVESEKTAIIASYFLPQFHWLACGSLTNLNEEKCKVLAGRTVLLFPDLRGFEKWEQKAKELSGITTFKVSDLLEKRASEVEKMQGLDIADYLLKYNDNYKEYRDLLSSNEIETLRQFDIWIKSNPQGGLFNYKNGQLFVKKKQTILNI